MTASENRGLPLPVRGAGDVSSAVAVLLFRAGFSVALHDEDAPPRHAVEWPLLMQCLTA
jgi:hypothetical protein